jgi:phage tail sheath protein FI
MPEYLSPGVYVEEVEQGPKPIEGVSTSTAGFLGETERGPIAPKRVTSFAEFERKYGSYLENRYLAYGVQGFFRNGGKRCYVGRITAEEKTAVIRIGNSGEPQPGSLNASPRTLSFGTVEVGEDKPLTITLTNLGNAAENHPDVEVKSNNVTVSGEHATQFSRSLSDGKIQPEKTKNVKVTFTPETPGAKEATLVVKDSTGDELVSVSIVGNGAEPSPPRPGELVASPEVLEFGTVTVGHERKESVMLENLGDTGDPPIDIKAENVNIKGDGSTAFSENASTENVKPGDTKIVEITLKPGSPGTKEARLVVTNDSDDELASVRLLANATEAKEGDLSVASTNVEFGTVIVGHEKKLPIKVTNLGDPTKSHKTITIPPTNVSLAGEQASEFSLDISNPIQIPPGQSKSFDVTYSPITPGQKEATLVIDYAPDKDPLTIRLEGGEGVLEVRAIGPGRWGGHIAVFVENASLYKPGENRLFKLVVRYWRDEDDVKVAQKLRADPEKEGLNPPTKEEIHDNLSPASDSSEFVEKKINDVSNFIEIDQISSGKPPNSDKEPAWLTANFPKTNPKITVSTFEGDGTVPPDQRTGFAGLEVIDPISIVCVPDEHVYSNIPQNALTEAIKDHCELLKDRFAVLQSTQGLLKQEEPPVDSKYAAFYYPWIKVADPRSGAKKLIPPGGHVVGIYARSDTERGVHKAPANEVVRGAMELEFNLSTGDQDVLNPQGIDCIRSFRGRGIRVWGARTTTSDPLWKYINVRRLFLYIEESIDEGTQWVVFEPNDEKLWARVRQTISNFLTSVWRDGALMGTTVEEAFYVKCDRSTMTQNDIDNGKLIVEIGVSPVKPAEFVIFRISQWTASAEGA